ncbi:MAG: CbiX/SirB N-terminal domain-containing protein [Arenicellales bacterium]
MRVDPDETVVLLVAHGSRVSESNTEFEALARRLAGEPKSGGGVAHAFLELARPSIPEAIDALAGSGTRRIVVVPYLLSAGRHVKEDIPALAEEARRRHPHLAIELTDHFGALPEVQELLSDLVSNRHER